MTRIASASAGRRRSRRGRRRSAPSPPTATRKGATRADAPSRRPARVRRGASRGRQHRSAGSSRRGAPARTRRPRRRRARCSPRSTRRPRRCAGGRVDRHHHRFGAQPGVVGGQPVIDERAECEVGSTGVDAGPLGAQHRDRDRDMTTAVDRRDRPRDGAGPWPSRAHRVSAGFGTPPRGISRRPIRVNSAGRMSSATDAAMTRPRRRRCRST